MTTRIARFTAASALALGLGAVAAGPALASGSAWSGAVPPSTTAVEDGLGTDALILSAGSEAPDMRSADASADSFNLSAWTSPTK